MIKLIAFDLDGTIGDTVPMCIRAFEKAVSPYAGHTLSEREITQTFGLNEVGMIKKVAGEKWREALHEFYPVYEEMHQSCPAPYEGIRELIKTAASRLSNSACGICSVPSRPERKINQTRRKPLKNFCMTSA